MEINKKWATQENFSKFLAFSLKKWALEEIFSSSAHFYNCISLFVGVYGKFLIHRPFSHVFWSPGLFPWAYGEKSGSTAHFPAVFTTHGTFPWAYRKNCFSPSITGLGKINTSHSTSRSRISYYSSHRNRVFSRAVYSIPHKSVPNSYRKQLLETNNKPTTGSEENPSTSQPPQQSPPCG